MPSRKPGTVRIIAGEWRGRRLPVPDIEGLRPSGDRGRETLFSWLQPHLRGKVCVDLFAGTGVLGLEAVSRGAAAATLVDESQTVAASLRASIATLGAKSVSVFEGDALHWLDNQAARSADIVFIDPPFGFGLGDGALERLLAKELLRPEGFVYLESARSELLHLDPAFETVKDKVLGEVRMRLLRPPGH